MNGKGRARESLEPPDYRFDLAKGVTPEEGIRRMRIAHNLAYSASTNPGAMDLNTKKGVCATSSIKTPGCNGGSWTGCGSNTFPAGDFPACHSSLMSMT